MDLSRRKAAVENKGKAIRQATSFFVTAVFVVALWAQTGYAVSTQATLPRCAHEVPSGSVVDPAVGTVLLPNGTVVSTNNLPCMGSGFPAWQTTGNAAYGTMTLSGSYYYTNFQDLWTVPPAPSNGQFTSPQGLAFYNGLQGGNDIVQPLLVYGCITSTDCSNSWRIAGYACFSCSTIFQSVYYSPPLSVSKGDTIEGTLILTPSTPGCSGSGPSYTVAARDETTVPVQTTTLVVCDTDHYQIGIAGSLEVHSLSTCNQMPGSGNNYFQTISCTTSPSGGSPSFNTGSDVSFCSANAFWLGGGSTLQINWSYS